MKNHQVTGAVYFFILLLGDAAEVSYIKVTYAKVLVWTSQYENLMMLESTSIYFKRTSHFSWKAKKSCGNIYIIYFLLTMIFTNNKKYSNYGIFTGLKSRQ